MTAARGGYAQRRVLVAGAGVAGVAAARALLAAGADVTVVDRVDSAALTALSDAGAAVRLSVDPGGELLDGVSDVVLSPGFPPHHGLARAAATARLEVYSEPELAWRLRGPQAPPWLAVTGTNGKTTTTTMLAGILAAAGARVAALGNIGEPLVGVSADRARYDVLAVELSSFQLHWSRDLAPEFGAWLNLAPDHLDWHGGYAAYAAAKARVWRSATPLGRGTAVGNLDDPAVAAALGAVSGATVGWTLGAPAPGQVGVVDGVLCDASMVELMPVAQVRPAGAHNLSNALAAAALARAYGVPAAAVRDGLSGYTPLPHRNVEVAVVGGVRYVNDSKATNPHAALASLTSRSGIVWIGGGQLKGTDVEPLVAAVGAGLDGAVLLGVDRAEIASSLARHAPRVPVVDIASTDDGAMGQAVRAAAALARPGGTVLLAPAAASLDMFAGYAERGRAFVAAVRALEGS